MLPWKHLLTTFNKATVTLSLSVRLILVPRRAPLLVLLSPPSPGKIQTFIARFCPQFLMLKNKTLSFSRPYLWSWLWPPNQANSSLQISRTASLSAVRTTEFVSTPYPLPGILSSTDCRLLLSRFYLSQSGWFTLLCPLCVGCSTASDMDECCLCGLGMPIRSVYRTKYNIKVRSQYLCEKKCCYFVEY